MTPNHPVKTNLAKSASQLSQALPNLQNIHCLSKSPKILNFGAFFRYKTQRFSTLLGLSFSVISGCRLPIIPNNPPVFISPFSKYCGGKGLAD